MSPRRILPAASLLLLALLLAPAGGASAAPFDVSLSFGSLPSAQGFTYAAVGSHAGVPESGVFSVSGGAFQLYRDGTLVHAGSGRFAFSGSRVFFGDGTGGANAHGQVTALRFSQDLATPALPSTWGRLKELFATH